MPLSYKITADGSGFTRTLNGLRGQVTAWSGQLKGLVAGAFSIGAITNFLARATSLVNEIQDVNDRLGVTPKLIKTIREEFKSSGRELSDFEKTFSKFDAAARRALKPGDKSDTLLRKTFNKLDVDLGNTPDERVRAFVSAFQQRDKLSVDEQDKLFGRTGPLAARAIEGLSKRDLAGGPDEKLTKFAEAVDKFGLIIDRLALKLSPLLGDVAETANQGLNAVDKPSANNVEAVANAMAKLYEKYEVVPTPARFLFKSIGKIANLWRGGGNVSTTAPFFNPFRVQGMQPPPGGPLNPGGPSVAPTTAEKARTIFEQYRLTAEESEKLLQDLFKLELQVSGAAERRVKLEERFNELLKKAKQERDTGLDPSESIKEAADVSGQLAALASRSKPEAANELARVGTFTSDATARTQSVQDGILQTVKSQLNELKGVHKTLRGEGE